MGLVALRHVGSSRTRDRTRVRCIGRRILNHCTTREAQDCSLDHCDMGLYINKIGHELIIVKGGQWVQGVLFHYTIFKFMYMFDILHNTFKIT